MTENELLFTAKEARKNAYAPYSHFAVGAALLASDGSVFTGCNIENASFSATCCAERAALFAAVSRGVTHFSALAVVGEKIGKEPDSPCPPCGVCRQALAEFCPPEFPILLSDGDQIKTIRLGELLPEAFTNKNIQRKG